MRFKPVDPKVNFPDLEEEILKFWKENKTFEQSVDERPDNKRWVFLDGPPFITGMPHYGTLLSSIPKDVFPRFKTMQGYKVPRVWGWDCHGLPAENKVEQKLGIKSKREIEEKIGIKKFIDECKLYVSEVSEEWEWYVDHIARWVDFKHAYRTMDTSYMESVMWVFKQMYEKGYIYKGLRVSLYCPHCGTPISNFEVAMDAENHKEIVDPGTTYKYQLKDAKDTFVLAWSTTPWNKIVTPALAVNPNLTYVQVQQGDEKYILAKTTLKMLTGEYKILDEFPGSTLVGKKFVPHYDYYPIEPGEKAFEIIPGDFVTAEEGTGVVTIAAYGEEDLVVMQKEHVHIETHLDDEGTIKADVPKFGGMYYLKANKFVDEDLEKRGLIYKKEAHPHKVALCWRCGTRLYHSPQDAWYVNVQMLKETLKKSNEAVNWFPKHFKYGRFLKSLESAPDWNISRSRYWGSPVPVWECECGERFVAGSIQELEERSKQKVNDLHKPEIDAVTISCTKCGGTMHRVPEVLDSWIEAGSASFGERHYPFEKKESVEEFFPPEFIAEYTGQIRAWFYVVHVIANALALREDGKNYLAKNVLVTGVILGTDGRKMSKNYGNYPDPKEMIQKYGGDALRLYLLGSPVMHGEDIIISEEQYRNQVRGMMLVLWNVYNFFVTYANIDGWEMGTGKSKNILDEWIISLLHQLIKDVTESLEKFDTVVAIDKLQKFVAEFSTWYIRRSRDRVGPSAEDKKDKDAFYMTTYEVLTTLAKLLAPITPFLSESIYKNLTGEASVHLTAWPTYDEQFLNKKLMTEMDVAREIVQYGHAKRKTEGWGVKDPKKELAFTAPGDYSPLANNPEIMQLVLDELNTYAVNISGKLEFKHADFANVTEEMLQQQGEARRIVRKIQEERKKLGTSLDDKVIVELPKWPEAFEDYIKSQALVTSLKKGDTLKVTVS